MEMRSRSLVFLAILLFAAHTVAQPANEIDATRQASEGIFSWFKELQNHVSELVGSAERHQLVNQLKDLRKDLYNLEQDKSFFLDELSRGRLDHYQLNRAADDFNESIRAARISVREVGLSLREQYREGGIEVERALRKATSDRKGWVQRFKDSISSGSPMDPSPHIADGRKAVEALKSASIELTKLVSKLESVP